MSVIVKRLSAKSWSYETKPSEKKPPFQPTAKTSSQGITNRLVFSNPTPPSPSKCQLYESDYQYISKINAVLSKYPELMSSSRRMTGVLADILPGKSLEVNLLSFLIERGIFASIKESKLMDDYIVLLHKLNHNEFSSYEFLAQKYMKICETFNLFSSEPLIKSRLYYNLIGGFYLKTGNNSLKSFRMSCIIHCT